MAIIDIKEWIEQSREVTAHQHRCDARLVRLDSQRDDVTHQLHVFAEVFREAIIRALHRHEWLVLIFGVVRGLHHFAAHSGCPLFDFAYAGEVFIQFCAVFAADFMSQRCGIILDTVQNTGHPLAAIVVKEAVECLGWIDFAWNGRFGV